MRGRTSSSRPTGVLGDDVLRLAGERDDVALRDDGHDLADEGAAGLVVEGHDLRAAEHFQPARLLQGPQQHAHAFAGGGEDEAAEAEVGADAVDGEAGKALGADCGGVDSAVVAAGVAEALGRVAEVVAGRERGGLHLLLDDLRVGAAGALRDRWSS